MNMRRQGATLAGRLWSLVENQTWPRAYGTSFVSPAAVSSTFLVFSFFSFMSKLIIDGDVVIR